MSRQTCARCASLSPTISGAAPERLALERMHSAALGSSTGDGALRTSMLRSPALAKAASSTPSPPSENGPGCPGSSGGGNCARSRMNFTGIEKNALRSGVE
jgi:hypothetical protein